MPTTLISFLERPLVAVLLGLLTFALSVVVSYVFYRRALSVTRLDYAIADTQIVGAAFPHFDSDLEIRFRGQVVPRVVTSFFAVWNNGNQTISGDQLPDVDRFRIEVMDGEILQAAMLSESREVVNPGITTASDKRSATLSFNYLDPGDGFVVSLIHSGVAGKTKYRGQIRGLPEGLSPLRRQDRLAAGIILAANALPFTALLTVPYIFGDLAYNRYSSLMVFGSLTGTVLLVIFSRRVSTWLRKRSIPARFRSEPRVASVLPHLLDKSR